MPTPLTSQHMPAEQPGQHFDYKPGELPEPYANQSVRNAPLVVPRENRTPIVPEGFAVNVYAEGLSHPRRLLVLPNGDVLIAEQKTGYLTMTRDDNGDGKADWIERHASGFNLPYGLAYRDNDILVTDQDGIWRVPYHVGELRPPYAEEEPIDKVPPEKRKPEPTTDGQSMITPQGVFGLVQGHKNRDLAVDPKTGDLFVGVGSTGNIGVEPEVKGTIQRFAPDGSHQETYASGMRNPTAIAFQPETGDLWAVVQERDGLGDGLVPDYLARVRQGAFYGWPYAYIGPHPQPGFAEFAPDKVESTVTPELLFESHSSLLGLAFYDGTMFPEEYRGDLFVAAHGSWNREKPTGYKIMRVKFENGSPEGGYDNFATGFWVDGPERAHVWGRPADVAVAKDGALLVADDTSGIIWRIAYAGDGKGRVAKTESTENMKMSARGDAPASKPPRRKPAA